MNRSILQFDLDLGYPGVVYSSHKESTYIGVFQFNLSAIIRFFGFETGYMSLMNRVGRSTTRVSAIPILAVVGGTLWHNAYWDLELWLKGGMIGRSFEGMREFGWGGYVSLVFKPRYYPLRSNPRTPRWAQFFHFGPTLEFAYISEAIHSNIGHLLLLSLYFHVGLEY